ncbi:MAG: glutaredoxin domain-containing protein [Deltaproteobacteria bacterium]|nr:glutaredoxin domain-containing protein [Deltaproteobacteria bacterium]
MPSTKPNTIIMLIILVIILATTGGSYAAESLPQTILDPAVAKKSDYPKIVIYTVSWCPHCKGLKEYLTAHNIPFINRDVELEPAAMEELTGKYKTFGVPLIIIGNEQELLKGFAADQFEKTVEKVRSGNKP